MELQMLTSSCLKLQTVHHIPLSINKDGKAIHLYSFCALKKVKQKQNEFCFADMLSLSNRAPEQTQICMFFLFIIYIPLFFICFFSSLDCFSRGWILRSLWIPECYRPLCLRPQTESEWVTPVQMIKSQARQITQERANSDFFQPFAVLLNMQLLIFFCRSFPSIRSLLHIGGGLLWFLLE